MESALIYIVSKNFIGQQYYNSKSFMDEVSHYTSEMFIMGRWISVLFQSAVSIIRYISG